MSNWMKNNALILGILIIPFLVLALVWEQIPETVPTHWNAKGEADAFGSKMPFMFLMPAIGVLIQVICWIIPILDPKKQVKDFQKTLNTMQLIFAFLFFGLFLLILMTVLGYIENSSSFVLPIIIISFAFMGNYFTRLRPNYFIGIRTPWTLESEHNWRKTHRLGGRLWMGISLLMLVLYFVMQVEIFVWILIPGFLLMAFIPIGYSFWLFRKGGASS